MKIFVLNRSRECGYDEYVGFVICAENEENARKLASTMGFSEEEGKIWLNKNDTNCEEVKCDKEAIILDSFNAG